MEPTDTIWAIEDDKSYSIITAMAIVEVSRPLLANYRAAIIIRFIFVFLDT